MSTICHFLESLARGVPAVLAAVERDRAKEKIMKIVVEELGLGMLAIVGGLAVYKLVASVYLFITAF